jgi:hypothetical protein
MRFAAVHQMTDSTLKIHAQLWQMKVALIAPSVRQMTNVEDKNHFQDCYDFSNLNFDFVITHYHLSIIQYSITSRLQHQDAMCKTNGRHETKNIILHKVMQSAHSQTHR